MRVAFTPWWVHVGLFLRSDTVTSRDVAIGFSLKFEVPSFLPCSAWSHSPELYHISESSIVTLRGKRALKHIIFCLLHFETEISCGNTASRLFHKQYSIFYGLCVHISCISWFLHWLAKRVRAAKVFNGCLSDVIFSSEFALMWPTHLFLCLRQEGILG